MLFGVFTVNVLIIEPVIIFIETMYKKMVLYGSIIMGVIKEGVLTEVGSIGTLTVLSLIFLGSCTIALNYITTCYIKINDENIHNNYLHTGKQWCHRTFRFND